MHDRDSIRRLIADDETTIRGLTRSQGISRNAIRRAIWPGSRDTYHRHSEIDDYAEAVTDVLADYPHMAVSDIAVLVDWRRSRRRLSDLVAQLRPQHLERTATPAMSITDITAPALASVGVIDARRLDP